MLGKRQTLPPKPVADESCDSPQQTRGAIAEVATNLLAKLERKSVAKSGPQMKAAIASG